MSKQESYTKEYRGEAVKLVLEQGMTMKAASERLGMPLATLHSWVNAAKGSALSKASVTPGSRTVPELEAELSKLRRDFNEMRIERDIIKKAAAYFARESLPGTRT